MAVEEKYANERLAKDDLRIRGVSYASSGYSRSNGSGYYDRIVLASRKLPVGTQGLGYLLATNIAEEIEGVYTKKWNFGRGEDETRLGTVFAFDCCENDEIEEGLSRLTQAEEELSRRVKMILKG